MNVIDAVATGGAATHAPGADAKQSAAERDESEKSRARAALALLAALAAGSITQGLMWGAWGAWGARIGSSWLVLVVLFVAATMVVLRRVSAATLLFGGAAIALAGAVAWYASDWAKLVAWPASVAMLALLPFVAARATRLSDLGELPRALFGGLTATPRAIVQCTQLPRAALDARGRAETRRFFVGAALGIPITGVFVALLAADPSFASAAGRVADGSGTALRFALYSVMSGGAYLFVWILHTRACPQKDERAAVMATALARALPVPYRQVGDHEAPTTNALGPRLSPTAWAVALTQVVLVFALFVAVNAKTLFGGHALVTARGTPTYASYLHAGFLQLSLATLLAVVMVVVGHALLRDRTRGTLGGGAVVRALEVILLALTAVALASCAQRLRIYEEAYGYTYQRLAVGFFQAAVLGLLALTALKSIARGWRGYAASVAILGVGACVYAGTYDADLAIARGNVERAEAGRPLDVDYLLELGADATPILTHPYFGRDAESAQLLREVWSERAAEQRAHGWRSRRGIGASLGR